MATAVILGSAFRSEQLGGRPLVPIDLTTPFGNTIVHRYGQEAFVLFRHGVPHRCLPHQINLRAQASALAQLGCKSVLLTSSAGVLDLEVPLMRPLPVGDLLMLENRLPDGSLCTMFTEPSDEHGHLVLDGGLFSRELNQQLVQIAADEKIALGPRVIFAYAPGPRTKTPTENAFLAKQGVQVNSMSLGPETVLLNELEIPVVAVVVGHKYSHPDAGQGLANPDIAKSLEDSRQNLEQLAIAFLERARPVPFGNHLYRFG